MKHLKFEDLKLPTVIGGTVAREMCEEVARVVYEQMRDHYENEPEQTAPEWRLPDPPPGKEWHRTDWTEDMLPEGYRPLLLGEEVKIGDEWTPSHIWTEQIYDGVCPPERYEKLWHRTRRPLPAPVEYVPLGPEDVPPGSVVRTIGAEWWKQVAGVRKENIIIAGAGNLSWQVLAKDWVILRPGIQTWEPCKKLKK